MATSHFCNGKWRSGAVADCARHKRLDLKQTTVYARSVESGGKAPSESPKPSSSSSDDS
jgi:hypothetical protein